ncbi:hypothetical protein PMI41_03595 [Phyllobacterium sp. YR531]|nr:hypothetical protein PMI41_03595 [Phyllobacterium sp. YR531]
MRSRQIYTPLQCRTVVFSTDDQTLLYEAFRFGCVMTDVALGDAADR